MNILKDKINPSLDNKYYQDWVKTDKKVKFRDYVIIKFRNKIVEIMETM